MAEGTIVVVVLAQYLVRACAFFDFIFYAIDTVPFGPLFILQYRRDEVPHLFGVQS